MTRLTAVSAAVEISSQSPERVSRPCAPDPHQAGERRRRGARRCRGGPRPGRPWSSCHAPCALWVRGGQPEEEVLEPTSAARRSVRTTDASSAVRPTSTGLDLDLQPLAGAGDGEALAVSASASAVLSSAVTSRRLATVGPGQQRDFCRPGRRSAVADQDHLVGDLPTSCSRWLESRTVPPRRRTPLSRPRIQRMPAGRGRWPACPGSAPTGRRAARAMPSRCFMPRE